MAQVDTRKHFAREVRWCKEAIGKRVIACEVKFDEPEIWPGYFSTVVSIRLRLEDGKELSFDARCSDGEWLDGEWSDGELTAEWESSPLKWPSAVRA